MIHPLMCYDERERVVKVLNHVKNGLKCAVVDILGPFQHLHTISCPLLSTHNSFALQPSKNGWITDGNQTQQEIDHKIEYSGVSNSPIDKSPTSKPRLLPNWPRIA